MWAALRLRVVEARRRGGLLLAVLAFLAVGATAMWGGATPDGRYGLASDLAATLGYLLAILYGTVPVAADRERRRSYLPAASPVTPWGWALGNALGAGVVAAVTAGLLFVAAGLGTAASGGIETRTVFPADRSKAPAVVREPLPAIRVPAEARKLRLVALTELRDDVDTVGAAYAARLEIDGEPHTVHSELPIVVPIHSERVVIRNLTPEYRVGLVTREIRALGATRPFLANSAGVALAPALGAAAVAALGAAVGANLSAGVAALLVTLLLMLAAMKGFLGDALENEGSMQRTHHHGAAEPAGEGPLRMAAKGVLRGALAVLPDLDALDRTDRVATGEWTGVHGAGRASLILAIACVVAGGLGAVGVHQRRTP